MTQAPLTRPTRDRLLLAGLSLAAFALRAHRLGAQSLWSDEDISLDRAALAMRALLADLPVEQAPLYYLALRVWALLLGGADRLGDFALRYPSLIAGVLAVPIGAYAGARLAGRRAGLILALILALHPYLVAYGQEARMYTLLLLFGLAAPAAALRAESTGRRRAWVAAGLAAALAVYTHYYGALLVFTLAAWALADLAARPRRNARGWALAALAAALAFAPWLPRALGVLGFEGWRSGLVWTNAPWDHALAWSAGATSPAGLRPWALLVFGGLALAGTAALGLRWRGRRPGAGPGQAWGDRVGAARALLWLAIPTAAYALVVWRSLDPATGSVDYDPRYFFAALPAFYLVVAAGVDALPGPVAPLGALALVVLALAGVWRGYHDPQVWKQDYRGFLGVVERAAGHEDTVLLLDGPSLGLARRYEMADSPVKIVDLQSSGNRAGGPAQVEARVAELAAEYPHLWLAADGEAEGTALAWLEARAYRVARSDHQSVTLLRYFRPGTDPLDARPPVPGMAEPWLPPVLPGPPGEPIRPARADLTWRAPVSATAGALLPLRLEWRPAADLEPLAHLKVVLRQPGGEAIGAYDGQPTSWIPPGRRMFRRGVVVADRVALPLAPDAPPGDYVLSAQVYDPRTMIVLGTWAGPTLRVEAPP